MDVKKLLAMVAISVGGMIAMTCANMGGGTISGTWKGECNGTSTSLAAANGKVSITRGRSHFEAPFTAGEDNIAKFGKAEVHFHVDGLTRNLELDLPDLEPCFLKKG